MPTYTIRNKKTQTIFEVFCKYPELQEMLEDDPDLVQMLTTPSIISGIEGKTFKEDSGFRENMQRIAESHPNSALAEKYGTNRTNKDIKTMITPRMFKTMITQ